MPAKQTGKTGSPRHFRVLDSWRGVAACMVALLHLMVNSHIYPIPVIRSAGFFVDFFFVLSGFVIFANYEERLKQGYSAVKFMLLRFGRLYPLHLVTFLAFVAVDLLQIAVPGLQSYAKYAPFSAPGETPADMVSQLFLFHALDFEPVRAFNAPSWSISAEFYTYGVFAAALVLLRNKTVIFNLALFVLMPALLVAIMVQYQELSFIVDFLRCLYGFSAGALCWSIWKKYHDKVEKSSVPDLAWHGMEVLLVISIYILIALTAGTPFKHSAVWLFSLIILVFSFERGVVSKILNTRVFALLGLLSYSIYMVHVFIASKLFPILGKLAEKFFDIPLFVMIDGKEKLGVQLWHGDLISVIYMAVVIATSYVTYKLIEDPGRRYFRGLVYKKDS